MEAAGSSKTLEAIYQQTRCYGPEDLNLNFNFILVNSGILQHFLMLAISSQFNE